MSATKPAKRIRLSLLTKLAVLTGMVAILTATLANWIGFRFAQRSLTNQIQQRLRTVAHDRELRLLTYVNQQKERAHLVASRTRLRRLLAERLDQTETASESFQAESQRILVDALNSTPEFRSISITDPDGVVVVTTDKQFADHDYSDNPDFGPGKVSSHFGTPAYQEGAFHSLVTTSARTNEGRFLGVVMVLVDLRKMVELLGDTTGLGSTGEVLVGAHEGDRISYLLPSIRSGETSVATDQADTLLSAINGERGQDIREFGDRNVLAAWQPTPLQDRKMSKWGMVVKIDAEEAFAPIAHLRRIQWMLELSSVGVGTLCAFVLARRFTRPILQMAETARTIAGGQRDARVSVSSNDELGQLAAALNQMTDDLVESEANLEQRVEQRTSELASTNEQLLHARKEADLANKAKSEFLANMSHEIRTPMNAVIGMTELVLDTEISEVQREYLAMVKDSGESLLSLINDILDFSKIEAGKLELDNTPFEVRETLGDTMKLLAARNRHTDVELICRIAPDVPAVVWGDPYRLRQVVTNLVGNAVKFTHEGEIVLEAASMSRTKSHVQLKIAVSDTGLGIPDEKQKAIFSAFSQVDSSTTRRFGGTGLGLTITSRIVQQMGGNVQVESELGKGSTFTFSAKFRVGEEVPYDPSRLESLLGLRVLIVDDNATNRLVLGEMLNNWGMLSTTVCGAEEAIEELEAALASSEPYRLVLTDVHMPDVDGFQLTKRIKRDERLQSTIIMMLSSGDGPGDIARCRALGGAMHVLKPVKQSDLYSAICTSLGSTNEAPPSHDDADSTPTMTPLRILLAEDSYVNQRLAVGLLEKWGHRVSVADNGRKAVAKMDEDDFDLVLMDIQMPEMDGYQATAVIRRIEAKSGQHTPIIAMTAHAMKGDREQCIAAGMDEYCSKPIRIDELRAAIQRVGGLTFDAVATPTEEIHVSSSSGKIGKLNWDAARNAVGGNAELLIEILKIMLDEGPRCIDQIDESIQKADAALLRRGAHTFRGTVRIFGTTRAGELAGDLEQLGMDGSFSGAEALFEQLQNAGDAIYREVKTFLAKSETG